MPPFLKETLALLVFIVACALIFLQVTGTYGDAPKYILVAGIVIGVLCLRYTRIRGAQ